MKYIVIKENYTLNVVSTEAVMISTVVFSN